jgi:hypothetical protein
MELSTHWNNCIRYQGMVFLINNKKNSEFIMRLSKTLELKNIEYILSLTEKKLIFAVERNTGVVQTYFIDYNPDREVRIVPL